MRPLICLAAGGCWGCAKQNTEYVSHVSTYVSQKRKGKKKKKKRLDYISLYSGMKNRIIQVFLKLSYVILIVPSKYHQKERGYMHRCPAFSTVWHVILYRY